MSQDSWTRWPDGGPKYLSAKVEYVHNSVGNKPRICEFQANGKALYCDDTKSTSDIGLPSIILNLEGSWAYYCRKTASALNE